MPSRVGPLRRSLHLSLCLNMLAIPVLHAADLPVKQVTLYKHGIGFFEREGAVPAGEEVRLEFKNSEMNDVLKSFIVSSANGASISAVRYDSNATLDQQLDKYPFSIGSGELLSTFLDRLKGSHVSIKMGGQTLLGVILGSRGIRSDSDEKHYAAGEQLTLVLDSGDLSNFDLAGINSLHFLDRRLQTQLNDYLATIARAKAKDKRSIYLASDSAAARSLHLSYIAPTAIWKSSYRLSLAPANSMLEGWATVDNTSDEDWSNVRLSVVSGRPISFISLLDVPRYGSREVAELPEDRAAGPMVYAGGITAAAPADLATMVPGAGLTVQEKMGASGDGIGDGSAQKYFHHDGTHLGNGNQPFPGQPNEFTSLEQRANLQSSIRGANGATLGELFKYDFDGPVTIRKNQSAMLPFLQDQVGARKLLIYQENDAEHPVNAVEVTNGTGKTLDGGPITVFDSGAYAGEALIETLKTGDKRLIGYAVDYGTRISSGFGATYRVVREISATNGVLQMRVAEQTQRSYTIQNVDTKAKTVVIEQPGINEYSVLSPTPSERTATAYRFEVTVPAAGSKALTVKQEKLLSQEIMVSTAATDFILDIVQNKTLSEVGRRQLASILELKRQIADAGADFDAAKSKLRDLTEEETRLRENIASLNQVKGQDDQVRQYASQLSLNESNMAKFRDQSDARAERKLLLETQLREATAKLQF